MEFQLSEEAEAAVEQHASTVSDFVESEVEDHIKPLRQEIEEIKARLKALEAKLS